MKRVLVTGANGMLGGDVCSALEAAGFEAIATARRDAPHVLDVTNIEQARKLLEDLTPHALIHCAAYTAVDRAESEPEEAFRINETGSRVIATACAEYKV